MVRVYVGVGSNLGDREAQIAQARESLNAWPGLHVRRNSPLYETEPVGDPPQRKYLNGVFEIDTYKAEWISPAWKARLSVQRNTTGAGTFKTAGWLMLFRENST